MARALRPPRNPGFEALKPTPAATIWQELDAMCAAAGMPKIVDPDPDMFSAAQYARKIGISPSTASIRLRKLMNSGKIEHVGTGINNAQYYRIKK